MITSTSRINLYKKESDASLVINHTWIKASITYLLSWFILYYDLPVFLRLIIVLGILVVQMSSYYNAAVLLLLVLFIPFFRNFHGLDINGLKLPRLIFLPFLYYSLLAPKRRNIQVNGITLFFVLISFLSIIFTSEIRKIIQDIPLSSGEDAAPGLKNTIARCVDTAIILSFLYYSFTRLSFLQLSNLLKLLLLFALLEAASIIFLVAQNPQSVIGSEFNKFYLWRNPFFGHKNDWGMMLVFIVHLAYLKSIQITRNKLFFRTVMISSLIAIAFSLSRQAYASVLVGFILIFIAQQKIKPFFYLSLLLVLLVLIQPTFLFDRIDALINVSSVNDFQDLSRKVGGLAIEQAKKNFTIAPQMFFTNWEYNWSEGFWNGLLHQQGIIGLLFHFLLYGYLISRYYHFFRTNHNSLQMFGLFGMVSCIIIFFSNFNRRATHLMHYDGNIEQIGFISLFVILYANLLYYSLKKNSKNVEEL